MQQYRQIIGTLNFWIFLSLIASLPFYHGIIRPLWVVWLVAWALELRWIERPHMSKEKLLSIAPVLALCGWVGWECLSLFWTQDPASTQGILGRHINLLAVLIISIFGVNRQYRTSTIVRTLIATSVISVGFYLMTHFWIDNLKAALSDEWRPDTQLDWLCMENLTMAMKHRLYYATTLTFALIGIVFLLPEHIRRFGKWQTVLLSTIAAIILLLGIWWSGSRMNMVNVVALSGIWAIWHTPGKKKLLTAAAVALAIGSLAWGALRYYPRFAGQPVAEIFAYHPEEEEPSFEPRVAIWHIALEAPGDYLLHGRGAGTSKAYMTGWYQVCGWNRLAERQYSPHCQYLTVCIELGLAAACAFLFIWLLMPFCYKGRAREYALYATAVMMLNMLTESYFDRIEGILFTCIILLIILRLSEEESPANRLS